MRVQPTSTISGAGWGGGGEELLGLDFVSCAHEMKLERREQDKVQVLQSER